MTPILSLQNLVKKYPKATAVNGISLDIPEGICFGFLGPNGAGKTTTIEMIEGILPPSSGVILYKGHPVSRAYQEEIGIQFQSTALQEKLTGREVLRMFGSLYKRSLSASELISLCNLADFADRETTKLSGGQRQRLLVAVALVNDPKVLFLDEPTTGLDPQARQLFWKLIESVKAQKKTVIMTTHYMEEAHTLCDELVIMDRGIIIAKGTPHDLLDRTFHGSTVKFPLTEIDPTKIPSSLNGHINGRFYEMHVADTTSVLKELLNAGINLQHVTIQRPTLEDLFLHMTELTGEKRS